MKINATYQPKMFRKNTGKIETKNNYNREKTATVEDNDSMDDGMDRTKKSPRQQLVDVFESWFEAEPSIYQPNLDDVIKLKQGKQIRRDHNPAKAITRKEYERYKASDAKSCTILFEFTPMGIKKEELCEKSDYLLKRKEMKNVPWSFGSCHACWKVRRNFSNERKTPHPYQSNIDNPNLSVLGGCGCIIYNGCVMEMEKYSEGKDDRCTGCPYCGHPEGPTHVVYFRAS
jgi:hypothetical protein